MSELPADGGSLYALGPGPCISAQLNGSGAVSCEIKIGGVIVSHGAASGSYNIASCEVVQDPIDGGWEDANSS